MTSDPQCRDDPGGKRDGIHRYVLHARHRVSVLWVCVLSSLPFSIRPANFATPSRRPSLLPKPASGRLYDVIFACRYTYLVSKRMPEEMLRGCMRRSFLKLSNEVDDRGFSSTTISIHSRSEGRLISICIHSCSIQIPF